MAKKRTASGPPPPWETAWTTLQGLPLFAPFSYRVRTVVHKNADAPLPRAVWAQVRTSGVVELRVAGRGDGRLVEQWTWALARCLVQLGLGHADPEHARRDPHAWAAACAPSTDLMLATLKMGTRPDDVPALPDFLEGRKGDPASLYEEVAGRGVGTYPADVLAEPLERWQRNAGYQVQWQRLFATGLRASIRRAVDDAAGMGERSRGQRALAAVMTRIPLMGALAAGFTVIEKADVCDRMKIDIAAVSAQSREIYLNPRAALSDEELLFVMAHELLHVGLRHHARVENRDHYLFNVAADLQINQWLVDMRIGQPPQIGMLLDPDLVGLSAEEIYDRITGDLRRLRKLKSLRGAGVGDMLGEDEWWTRGAGVGLDDFYRRALAEGLQLHQQMNRGLLPAGLVEEIERQAVPAPPWDVMLAEWFERWILPPDRVRSYGRPSRRQDAAPDIPLPRSVVRETVAPGRVFAVVLDTSASMDRRLLGEALGAIAAFAVQREASAVRVVYCDAHPYDAGWMAPESLLGSVEVEGRGGTVLQPAIDLVDAAEDIPAATPLLIITDGWCDALHVHPSRPHAYLLPAGQTLPFAPQGEVFHLR